MDTKITENKMLDLSSTIALIKQGKPLVISGNDELLEQLPTGNWIGGTANYFYIKGKGGRVEKDMLFVTDFSDIAKEFKITVYKELELKNVCTNGFENGFNFLILPYARNIHFSFSLNAPNYEDQFINPLIGLVAGGDFDEVKEGRLSQVFNGATGEVYTDDGVAMHCSLPDNKVARLEIINVFEPKEEDVVFEVPENSFSVGTCLINGKEASLYDFFKEIEWDIRFPIVANYGGAIINIAFFMFDDEKKEVVFAAPLFKGYQYKLSNSFESYSELFHKRVQKVFEQETNVVYNCNCLYNYFYGELEKHDIGFSGPTTYGEIGFQILNQTFTYLAIDEY